MANQFIGLHMRVILRDPQGYQLTGTVRDVEAGSSLTLTNVFVTGTKEWAPQMSIDAANIADLSEIKAEEPPATYAAPAAEPVVAPVFSPPVPQSTFTDPAILSSLPRRPTSSNPSASDAPARHRGLDLREPQLGQPGVLPEIRIGGDLYVPTSIQDGTDPAEIVAHELDNGAPMEATDSRQQKTKRRSRQTKQPKAQLEENLQPEGSPNAQNKRGKGWRQTPILSSTASFQPFNSLKRNGKGGKGGVDNGWASEEVTEEMPEFDFQDNLAKFDKRTIFDQMRKEDQVDDASRLVSHNRKVKPGTAGGKNLHYTENVLDVQTVTAKNADFWNSEADDGLNEGERVSGRESKNGHGGRRPDSKTGTSRRSQSRKASTTVASQVAALPLSRVSSSKGHQPGLYLVPSDTRLEAISTLQMLNLENIAANEIGFTEDLMAENAGRGIAEVALTALADPAMKVRFELATAGSSLDAAMQTSTVVILAGNNKSGIRALAAGRHMRNKNINVVVCLVGVERERDLLEDLRRQIHLYRAFGGKVLGKNDFFEHLRKNSASGARVSVALIIDALLGLTISFEELRVGDQATVYELMEWANRNEAFVLSVDIPSGVDPASGKIAIIDGGPLFVKPRYVVAIGVPKRGLLEAVTPPRDGEPEALGSTAQEDEWRLFVADLGLGSAVWRKAGTKVRRGVDFAGKWVLEMRYRGAATTAAGEEEA